MIILISLIEQSSHGDRVHILSHWRNRSRTNRFQWDNCVRQNRLSHCFWSVGQLYLSHTLVPYQTQVLERDYREWDNFSHSPQGKHYLTSLEYQRMTTQQRIEAAKQRIAELERLIKAWKTKSIITFL